MNLTITVDYTGTPDSDDVRAAKQSIFDENTRRATLIPPGTILPSGTSPEIKASYVGLLAAQVSATHLRNILIAKTQAVSSRFTDSQLQTIFGNLIDQLNAGATVAAVIAKTV